MKNWEFPRVYPILDAEALAARGLAMELAAEALLEGGARILQIRNKGHWSRAAFAAARQVAALCAETGARLMVNDRADFAMLLGAGLHVGQDDLEPAAARALMGGEPVIGFSSHNADQLIAAVAEPVDYVALGPVFATASKRNPDPVVGIEALARCRPLLSLPLVAIGGITLENARQAYGAGADSVALIAALLPEEPTRKSIRARMEEWQRIATAV